MPKALKFDVKKVMHQLAPTFAEEKWAEAYTHGAAKYDEENWRNGIQYKRIIGAIKRHLGAFIKGEDIVPDQGSFHLAAVMWGAATLLEMTLTGKGTDDRVKDPRVNPMFQIEPGNLGHLEYQEKLFWAIYDAFAENNQIKHPDKKCLKPDEFLPEIWEKFGKMRAELDKNPTEEPEVETPIKAGEQAFSIVSYKLKNGKVYGVTTSGKEYLLPVKSK